MTYPPNIFNYATSELSQDAFICYLLAFGNVNFKGSKEYNAAHRFLEECGICGEDVVDIKRQYNKIDVLVITDKHLLIIEDKTYSNEHSDQILHYVEELKKDEAYQDKKENIKVCFFKTGDYLHPYKTSNTNILKQEDCKSLGREYILKLLQDIRQDNLIFDSFCTYWETPDKLEDIEDISTWKKSTWFQYLKKLFEENHISENDQKCDINSYVPNSSGGFYATHFNWKALPESDNIEKFDGKKKNKAETYKQIEIYFSDGITSRINLAYRFHSNNGNKDETKEYKEKGILGKLQRQVGNDYKEQNRMGASTAYKVKTYFKYYNSKNIKKDMMISRETTEKIKDTIKKFICAK